MKLGRNFAEGTTNPSLMDAQIAKLYEHSAFSSKNSEKRQGTSSITPHFPNSGK
jgi:hypothetical protein